MTYSSTIEDTIREMYSTHTDHLVALAQSHQVPAICLTGEDESLLNYMIRIFLSSYENKKYSEIFNSNDFFEIGSDNGPIKIDDIRNLIRFSTLKKEHLKHKYTVIKNIDRGNVYAQNSLLKVIEEPGIDTLFLCSTCSYQSLLNTVRSRLFRINIPSIPLKEMENVFCDEITWLAKDSLDVLIDFSQLSKPEQRQFIELLRNKSLTELAEDYLRSCGGYEWDFEKGITLKGSSLNKLFALMFTEKLIQQIFNNPEEVRLLIFEFKTLTAKKTLFKTTGEKPSTTQLNNIFFKRLFSVTERIIYMMLNFSEGLLMGTYSYTFLTRLCLKNKPAIKKESFRHYLAFLEQIKNYNQISLNTELLMINYILKTQKIFNESESKKWE